MENYYNKYSEDLIHCEFCGKNIILYNYKKHLKSQKCKTLQNMMKNIDKIEYKKKMLNQLKHINVIKSNII